jgi:hypothetical protein
MLVAPPSPAVCVRGWHILHLALAKSLCVYLCVCVCVYVCVCVCHILFAVVVDVAHQHRVFETHSVYSSVRDSVVQHYL